MGEAATDADRLRGKEVAFTGRLASMTRKEATAFVRSLGGDFVASLTKSTAFLVIGQEGWPLRTDGKLSRKLQKARLLQRRGCPLRVVAEEDWLTEMGLGAPSDGIRCLLGAAEVARIVGVSRDQLRAWTGTGLVRPVEIVHGLAYFDFRAVTGVKTLCDLLKTGVTVRRLRKSLEQIRAWTGGADEPFAQLAILEKNGDLLLRHGNALAEPTGQLRFDFEGPVPESTAALPAAKPSADDLFESGCELEEAGRLTEAEAAYRQALLAGGPDPTCEFNLANVLYAQGRKSEAAERFHHLVEIDNTNGEAWNNLATVLVDLQRHDRAVAAYEKAIELGYMDAHYNLADALAAMGRDDQARKHWRAYLCHDQRSEWAKHAQKRLAQPS